MKQNSSKNENDLFTCKNLQNCKEYKQKQTKPKKHTRFNLPITFSSQVLISDKAFCPNLHLSVSLKGSTCDNIVNWSSMDESR